MNMSIKKKKKKEKKQSHSPLSCKFLHYWDKFVVREFDLIAALIAITDDMQ